METKIVSVDLGSRAYDVYIGDGLLYRLEDFIPFDLAGRKAFVIADAGLGERAAILRDYCLEAGARESFLYALPASEQDKSFARVEEICLWLLEKGAERSSFIMSLGGGITGDVAGFCASITLRGIPYIQIPSTFLAQVDSSVGGKTGINTRFGKNMIGAFYQPAAVIIDTALLKSLPARHFLAGYAELVKYGLMQDEAFFRWLEMNGRAVCAQEPAALISAVERAVKTKAAIVMADEQEHSGQRALLNLGHTFGHALEAATGYDGRLLHGEAVAIGICMAFDLSVRMGFCARADMERVQEHFSAAGLPTRAAQIEPALIAGAQDIAALMRHDKKSAAGRVHFVLARGIGEAFISADVSMDLVNAVIRDSLDQGDQQRMKGIKERWKSAYYSRA